jgi:hypothetical protein
MTEQDFRGFVVDPGFAEADGGYHILMHMGCMATWYEAVLVNGERCHPRVGEACIASERHLHLSVGLAKDCARTRLAQGITMPGPSK